MVAARIWWCTLLALAVLAVYPTAALAQAPAGDPFRARSFELDLGGAWLGGIDFGTSQADLTGNQLDGPSYPFFEVDSALKAAPGFEGRLGFRVTRVFAIEGALIWSQPRLESRISDDVEDAPDVTAVEDLTQYIVDVSAVVHLTRFRLGQNAVPFVLGGAGYLRQLHEGQTLVETGQVYHAGGGVKYVFSQRTRGLIRSLGLRVDARLYVRQGGFDLDEDEPTRTFGAGGASLIVGF